VFQVDFKGILILGK